MVLGEAMMWILGGMLIAGMLVVLYMSMDINRYTGESDAPYKLEPAEQLAVSDKPKKRGRPVGTKGRKYTKRSTYWTDTRKRSAAKKARKEKMQAARAKARAAIGS